VGISLVISAVGAAKRANVLCLTKVKKSRLCFKEQNLGERKAGDCSKKEKGGGLLIVLFGGGKKMKKIVRGRTGSCDVRGSMWWGTGSAAEEKRPWGGGWDVSRKKYVRGANTEGTGAIVEWVRGSSNPTSTG